MKKLTAEQKRLVKEYARKLIITESTPTDDERILPNELLKRIKRNVESFKKELTKAGYEFSSKRRK